LTDRLLERRRAAFGQRPHDIALGQYAIDLLVGSSDDQRTDPVCGERLDCVCQRCGRINGNDVGAFAAHYGFHGHGLRPSFRCPNAPTGLIVRRRESRRTNPSPFDAGAGQKIFAREKNDRKTRASHVSETDHPPPAARS
jgi:hypothetical protein